MADRFQFARGTASEWTTANPTLREGEIGFVTDTGQFKIGDGVTAWNSLQFPTLTGGAFDSLLFNETSDPSAPAAGTGRLYVKNVGGRIVPKFIGPSGIDTILQNAIFGNGIRIAAPGTSTALSYFGMGAFTAVGTVSHPALTASSLRESTSRAIVTSAATANSASELRFAATQCWRGNGAGLGGFFATFRFSVSSSVATQRCAVGLWAATGATSTSGEPSALVNGIWVGNDAADSNLQLMCNDGTGTASKVDLGGDFVKNQSTAIYELTLFCKPNDLKIGYRVKRLDGAGEAVGEVSADIPAGATFLAPHFYLNNGGTASAVVLDVFRYYLETDY